MSTPDIIEEKIAEYLRLCLNPDLSGAEPDPIEDMKAWLRNTLTTIYQRGREDENREIIKIAESCDECGKPKHIHPHDFYDNDLDCNCPAKK